MEIKFFKNRLNKALKESNYVKYEGIGLIKGDKNMFYVTNQKDLKKLNKRLIWMMDLGRIQYTDTVMEVFYKNGIKAFTVIVKEDLQI